jgi:hypothetical protein
MPAPESITYECVCGEESYDPEPCSDECRRKMYMIYMYYIKKGLIKSPLDRRRRDDDW